MKDVSCRHDKANTRARKTGYLCGGYYIHPAKKVTSSQREPFTPDWQLKDPNDPKGMWWLSDGTMCGFRVVCEE